jgi:hypothetical protein
MAAAVAVPLVVAAIGAGATVYAANQASKNKPSLPPIPKVPALPDQAPLDAQAAQRRRAVAASQSTLLTGPQGLGADASQKRATLLGAAAA